MTSYVVPPSPPPPTPDKDGLWEEEPVRWDHSSNTYNSLMTITKEDATSEATTTLTLGTDIVRSTFDKCDCGTESESDCDPEENDLVDEVALIEIVLSISPRRNILQGAVRNYPQKIGETYRTNLRGVIR